MKAISQQTAYLLVWLRRKAGWIFRSKTAERGEAVRQIGASGETQAIVELVPQLLDRDREVALAVSDTISRLLSACSPDDILDLDVSVRWLTWSDIGKEWAGLRPQNVQSLPTTQESRGAVFGVVSCHSNGYVREAAVHQLAELDDGSEIPFLLIRNNDWVAQVRGAARAAIERRVRDNRFEFSDDNLYLLFRLLDQKRAEHSQLVETVARELVQPEHLPILFSALENSDRFVRRRAFSVATEIPGKHLDVLIPVGLRSADPVIRLWSVRKAASVFDGNALATLLTDAEADSFLPVRREVLWARLQHFPDQAEEHLKATMLDRSQTLRQEARFYLRKRGMTDFLHVYQAKLSDEKQCEIAIAGIGETGGEPDAELIVPFLKSERSRLRKAATRAVGQLAPKRHLELLFQQLSDESPKVSREAARSLSEQAAEIGIERLWQLFQQDHRPHVKLAALELLDEFGTWRKLPLLIEAAADSDRRVAAFAKASCERPVNRVFTRPSAEEQRKIWAAMDTYHDSLEPRFRDEMLAWLESLVR